MVTKETCPVPYGLHSGVLPCPEALQAMLTSSGGQGRAGEKVSCLAESLEGSSWTRSKILLQYPPDFRDSRPCPAPSTAPGCSQGSGELQEFLRAGRALPKALG